MNFDLSQLLRGSKAYIQAFVQTDNPISNHLAKQVPNKIINNPKNIKNIKNALDLTKKMKLKKPSISQDVTVDLNEHPDLDYDYTRMMDSGLLSDDNSVLLTDDISNLLNSNAKLLSSISSNNNEVPPFARPPSSFYPDSSIQSLSTPSFSFNSIDSSPEQTLTDPTLSMGSDMDFKMPKQLSKKSKKSFLKGFKSLKDGIKNFDPMGFNGFGWKQLQDIDRSETRLKRKALKRWRNMKKILAKKKRLDNLKINRLKRQLDRASALDDFGIDPITLLQLKLSNNKNLDDFGSLSALPSDDPLNINDDDFEDELSFDVDVPLDNLISDPDEDEDSMDRNERRRRRKNYDDDDDEDDDDLEDKKTARKRKRKNNNDDDDLSDDDQYKDDDVMKAGRKKKSKLPKRNSRRNRMVVMKNNVMKNNTKDNEKKNNDKNKDKKKDKKKKQQKKKGKKK